MSPCPTCGCAMAQVDPPPVILGPEFTSPPGAFAAIDADLPVWLLGKRYIRDPEDIPPVVYSPREARAMRDALLALDRTVGNA